MLAFLASSLDLRSSLLTLSHIQASLHGFRLHASMRASVLSSSFYSFLSYLKWPKNLGAKVRRFSELCNTQKLGFFSAVLPKQHPKPINHK